MAYASPADLVARFGEQQLLAVADRDQIGELHAAVLAAALADADQEIDAYLATRYRLPLAAVPGRIKAAACDIAFYRLHPAAQPEDVRRRYADAIAFLRDLAAGKAALDLAGGQPQAAEGGTATLAGPPRVFSRETLKGL